MNSTPPHFIWTLRLLAGTCFYGAWVYISYAIHAQSPDDYWVGIALAGEGLGLLRRLHWSRIFGLLGLALFAAWVLWEQSRNGATVGGALAVGLALLAAFPLARYPQYFSPSWW